MWVIIKILMLIIYKTSNNHPLTMLNFNNKLTKIRIFKITMDTIIIIWINNRTLVFKTITVITKITRINNKNIPNSLNNIPTNRNRISSLIITTIWTTITLMDNKCLNPISNITITTILIIVEMEAIIKTINRINNTPLNNNSIKEVILSTNSPLQIVLINKEIIIIWIIFKISLNNKKMEILILAILSGIQTVLCKITIDNQVITLITDKIVIHLWVSNKIFPLNLKLLNLILTLNPSKINKANNINNSLIIINSNINNNHLMINSTKIIINHLHLNLTKITNKIKIRVINSNHNNNNSQGIIITNKIHIKIISRDNLNNWMVVIILLNNIRILLLNNNSRTISSKTILITINSLSMINNKGVNNSIRIKIKIWIINLNNLSPKIPIIIVIIITPILF